jgi:hypothetical protein
MKKMSPNSPDFEKITLPIARFLLLVPVGSQKYRNILIFSYFHNSTCGQIWLNHFQDDSHPPTVATSQKLKIENPNPKLINNNFKSFRFYRIMSLATLQVHKFMQKKLSIEGLKV